jgi:hypothetical protein
MIWCIFRSLAVLVFMVATTIGGDLPKEDECPLNGICVPECPTNNTECVKFFPHPKDCHWFFQCSNGNAYCMKCPADLHWNTELNICDYPYNAGCKEDNSTLTSTTDGAGPETTTTVVTTGPTDSDTTSSDIIDPTTSTTVTSEVVCPDGPIPECPFPDGNDSVYYPHPNDCHWFFQCSNGEAYCKVCPADLHWNTVLNVCDWPHDAGCNLSSTVTSSTDTTEPDTTTTVVTEDSTETVTSSSDIEEPQNTTTVVTEDSTESVTSSSVTSGSQTSTSVVPGGPNVCPECEVPKCPFPDPTYSVYFPHPSDCHWFFQCSNGVAYCMECPADLHWNRKLNVCDWPYSAGCDV